MVQPLPDMIARAPHVASSQWADGAYLFSFADGSLFRVSGPTAAIWSALREPVTDVPAFIRSVAGRLGYSEARIVRSIESLHSRELLTFHPAPPLRPVVDHRRSPALLSLWQEALRRCIPFKVNVELTLACNLKCPYCYIHGLPSHRALSTDQILAMISDLAQQGCMFITFTGGEPGLRRDLLTILRSASAAGMVVTLLTNATSFTSEDVEALARIPRLFVEISFHGSTAAHHDGFTGVPGSFESALRNAKEMVAAGIPVVAKLNVTAYNFEDRHETVRRLETEGLPTRVYGDVLPNVAGISTEPWRLSDEQVNQLVRDGVLRPEPRECSAARGKAWVGPDGTVYPCELLREPLGNVQNTPFQEVWSGSPAEEFRKRIVRYIDPPGCQACSVRSHCPRCPAYALLDHGSPLSPAVEACRIARFVG